MDLYRTVLHEAGVGLDVTCGGLCHPDISMTLGILPFTAAQSRG